jgi:valyl-tRNA synthetase
MIMMTQHFTGKVPFRDVYINALVRDAEGQKMSKSRGNTLDPLDLIDGISFEALLEKSTQGLMLEGHRAKIEQYVRNNYPEGIPSFGADALRFTYASLATFARTLNFDLARCEGYRNFCNKLWNATRFVLMNTETLAPRANGAAQAPSMPDRWIASLLERTAADVEKSFAEYRFDNVASALYRFVWDEYCDWYLELAKVQLQEGTPAEADATRRNLVGVLEATLRLAHPIIPFITEELWQRVAPRVRGGALPETASIMIADYPVSDPARIDAAAEAEMAELKSVIDAVRNLRSAMGLAPGQRVPLSATAGSGAARARLLHHAPYLRALARLTEVSISDTLPEGGIAPVQIVGDFRLMLSVQVDVDAELARLAREIARVTGELDQARARLSNDSFVAKAPPPVVAQVRERLAQCTATLAKLVEQRDHLRDGAGNSS